MSPNRRDLFKIAAGLGLTAAVPTSAERITAAQALDQRDSDQVVHDPAVFANEAQLLIGLHSDFTNDWIAAICPEESAAQRKTEWELEQLFPTFSDPVSEAVWDYAEATFTLALALYDAGVKHGAAFEHLRRSVIGELATCWPCRGVGILRTGDRCSDCGGTGLVATGTQAGR